ncbi:hypothetical protein ENBRE01_1496 [Enteropsectra breve]|nr:hypothetical protein ENBRE01_1496 [Enteropsectra breve]
MLRKEFFNALSFLNSAWEQTISLDTAVNLRESSNRPTKVVHENLTKTCTICQKSLSHIYDEYDKVLITFDNNDVIENNGLFSLTIVKCPAAGCGAFSHLSCQSKKINKTTERALNGNGNAYRYCFGYKCAACELNGICLNMPNRIFELLKKAQENVLLFKYIYTLLVNIGTDYLNLLLSERPSGIDYMNTHGDALRPGSAHQEYFLACIGLYNAINNTNNPHDIFASLKTYLSSFPARSYHMNYDFLPLYINAMTSSDAQILGTYIHEFVKATQPAMRSFLKHLWCHLLLKYAEKSTSREFLEFFVSILLSDSRDMLKCGRYSFQDSMGTYAALDAIVDSSLKTDFVLRELDRRMNDKNNSQKMFISQKTQCMWKLLDMWCANRHFTMKRNGLFWMFKRYFKLRSKETIDRNSFFSVYKDTFIDKHDTVHSSIYGDGILRISKKAINQENRSFYFILKITAFYEKRYATKKKVGYHLFMENLVKTEYFIAEPETNKLLEHHEMCYEINLIARHLGSKSASEQNTLLVNFGEKLADLNIATDYDMNSTLFRCIVEVLSKRENKHEMHSFIEKRIAHSCIYPSLDENMAIKLCRDICKRSSFKDTGLLPLCVAEEKIFSQLTKKDIWDWCDSVDFYSNVLDLFICSSHMNSFMEHYAIEIMEYCLEKDTGNEHIAVKANIVVALSRFIKKDYIGVRSLLKVLYSTKYPYELINACYYYMDKQSASIFLEILYLIIVPDNGKKPIDILTMTLDISSANLFLNEKIMRLPKLFFKRNKALNERFITYLNQVERLGISTPFREIIEDGTLLSRLASLNDYFLHNSCYIKHIPRFFINRLWESLNV